jgi:hypothetical protein
MSILIHEAECCSNVPLLSIILGHACLTLPWITRILVLVVKVNYALLFVLNLHQHFLKIIQNP